MKNTVIKIILFTLAAVPVAAQSGGVSRGQDVKNEQVRLSALRDIEKHSEDIKKYPEDPDAYLARARAYVKADRTTEAIADLTKAISVSKHPYYVAQATADRGKVYLKRGEYVEAGADFSAVIGLAGAEPYKAAAYLNRARSLDAKGERGAALKDVSEAIRLYSKQKSATAKVRLGEAYGLRAAISCAERNVKGASADRAKAIALGTKVNPCRSR